MAGVATELLVVNSNPPIPHFELSSTSYSPSSHPLTYSPPSTPLSNQPPKKSYIKTNSTNSQTSSNQTKKYQKTFHTHIGSTVAPTAPSSRHFIKGHYIYSNTRGPSQSTTPPVPPLPMPSLHPQHTSSLTFHLSRQRPSASYITIPTTSPQSHISRNKFNRCHYLSPPKGGDNDGSHY